MTVIRWFIWVCLPPVCCSSTVRLVLSTCTAAITYHPLGLSEPGPVGYCKLAHCVYICQSSLRRSIVLVISQEFCFNGIYKAFQTEMCNSLHSKTYVVEDKTSLSGVESEKLLLRRLGPSHVQEAWGFRTHTDPYVYQLIAESTLLKRDTMAQPSTLRPNAKAMGLSGCPMRRKSEYLVT